MGMDQDFPMSPTQAKVLVVGLVVMLAVGFALFGGFVPGMKPNYAPPATLMVNGAPYYYTTVSLNLPSIINNTTTPQAFTFHNVTFQLWLTNWYSPTGGLVRGNGTERNGSVASFVLGTSEHPPVSTSLFVSPDRAFAVYWEGGVFAGTSVRLMVHA